MKTEVPGHMALSSGPRHFLEGERKRRRSRPRLALQVTLALWLMLWGGYNTDIARLFEPGFPAGLMDFFHGVRSLFPFIAAFLASLMMLRRSSIPRWPLEGPVGLVALYALVGVISSILLSREPLTALYWVAEYGCVLVVLWALLSGTSSLDSLSRVLAVNWVIVTIATFSLLIGVGLLAGQALVPTGGSPLGVAAYAGSFAHNNEMLGMPATRNTGFGRFAAFAALVCMARLWQRGKRSKLLWLLLLVCSFALVLSQARTAVVAFLAGVLMMLWTKPGPRMARSAAALFGLALLGLTGSYAALWAYLMRGQAFDPTLTGRTKTWHEAWALFHGSPLLGWGFHADRIFLYYLAEGQHTHNAILHALIQTGLLGTVPLVAALVIAWILVVRLYRSQTLRGVPRLPLEIPAVLAFVTVASVTESTFALYNTYWLMVAPCFAYLQVVTRSQRGVKLSNAPHGYRAPYSAAAPGLALPKIVPP